MPFETLVAGAKSGASWATTALWQQYSPSVISFARGRGAHDAEGLASDAFHAAFNRLPSFTGSEADFRTMLFRFTYGRLVEQMRSESVHWRHKHDVLSQVMAADAARPTRVDEIYSAITLQQIADVLCRRRRAKRALRRGTFRNRRISPPTRAIADS